MCENVHRMNIYMLLLMSFRTKIDVIWEIFSNGEVPLILMKAVALGYKIQWRWGEERE